MKDISAQLNKLKNEKNVLTEEMGLKERESQHLLKEKNEIEVRAEHEREAYAAETNALRKKIAELEGEVERLRTADRSPDPCKISLIESDLISSIEH